MIAHIYLIKTHSGSLYEVQVNDQGGSRCRKNTDDWRTIRLREGEKDWLEKLTIGPSFSIPGIAETSLVKDYQHFVPSGEPKRITTQQFFGDLAQHVVDQVKGHH